VTEPSATDVNTCCGSAAAARAGHMPLTPAAITTAATASLRPSTQPNLADRSPAFPDSPVSHFCYHSTPAI
jgi:hypothetical protein